MKHLCSDSWEVGTYFHNMFVLAYNGNVSLKNIEAASWLDFEDGEIIILHDISYISKLEPFQNFTIITLEPI